MIRHNGQEYKIVVTTPAGRERYLSILKKYVYADMESGLVDGWQLWQNTVLQSDIDYLASMEAENPKVKRFFIPNIVPSYNNCDTMRSCEFFVNCWADDTIYIRFDDDIVWYEKDAIRKMAIARIEHPHSLVIYPNVINSTTVTSWHQKSGALSKEAGEVKQEELGSPDRAYLDEFCYTDSKLIDHIHNTFKSYHHLGNLVRYYLPSRVLADYNRFSICSLVWWGKDHLDPTGHPEEPWMAYEEAERQLRPNYFLGDCLMVHYSYHTQRDYLESCTPEHLEFYKKLAEQYVASK